MPTSTPFIQLYFMSVCIVAQNEPIEAEQSILNPVCMPKALEFNELCDESYTSMTCSSVNWPGATDAFLTLHIPILGLQ